MEHSAPEEALASYEKGLTTSPNDPDLHILAVDSCFTLGNFDLGIDHLKKAVELDKNKAIHWEGIGDFLQQCGQISDAIVAYEQAYKALPENVHILKKIGKCYRETTAA